MVDMSEVAKDLVIVFIVVAVLAFFVFGYVVPGIGEQERKFIQLFESGQLSAQSTLEPVSCHRAAAGTFNYEFVIESTFLSRKEDKFDFLALAQYQNKLLRGYKVVEGKPHTYKLRYPDDAAATILFVFPDLDKPAAEEVPLLISYWGISDCVTQYLDANRNPEFVKLADLCPQSYLHAAHTKANLPEESACRPALCPDYDEAVCRTKDVCYWAPGWLFGVGRGCKGCPAAGRCADFDHDACQSCGAAKSCEWHGQCIEKGELKGEITFDGATDAAGNLCDFRFTVKNTGREWVEADRMRVTIDCGIELYVPGTPNWFIVLQPGDSKTSDKIASQNPQCPKTPAGETWKLRLYRDCDDSGPFAVRCGPHAQRLAETEFRC